MPVYCPLTVARSDLQQMFNQSVNSVHPSAVNLHPVPQISCLTVNSVVKVT